MQLLRSEHRRRLITNGLWNAARVSRGLRPDDFLPVAKLFCPWSKAKWLLTELDPKDHDLAFGVCDLGMGFPETGCVRLSEIKAVTGPGGLRIQRDRSFTATKTLQGYAEEACRVGRVLA
jgi:hypothetical protein